MNIVIELQEDIINNKSDILSLLRKAFLISKKLGIIDFQEWISNELNGYPNGEVPNYRKIQGVLKAQNPYNGWIPMLISDKKFENLATNKFLTNSVAHILNLMDSNSKLFIMNCSTYECELFNSFAPFQTVYRVEFPIALLNNVIEQIKNTILSWTLILEEKGILGEGLTFTAQEKEIAHKEAQITNYITNIFGNVSDSQLQQGTSDSTQTN